MADLLNKKKKSNLLDRSSTPKPEQTFDRNNIYSVSEEKPKKAIKKPKVKTTTIRCSQDTANLINALTTIGDSKSVDETLVLLLDEYMIKLTDNERQQVKTIKKIYDKNSGLS